MEIALELSQFQVKKSIMWMGKNSMYYSMLDLYVLDMAFVIGTWYIHF